MTILSVNKRTVLGGQYWAIAAVGATTARAGPLALALAVVGAYLLLRPLLDARRSARPSRFLLRAK